MEFVKRNKLALGIAGGVLVAVAGLVAIFVFGVHTAFIDRTVDDEIVVVGDPTSPSAPQSPGAAPADPVLVGEGSFVSLSHPGTGEAQLITEPDGSAIVQLIDIDLDNGPDLRVVLADRADTTAYEAGDVDIGALEGNKGNQVFEVPADVDVGDVASVLIWCRRFDSTFNAASLAPSP